MTPETQRVLVGKTAVWGRDRPRGDFETLSLDTFTFFLTPSSKSCLLSIFYMLSIRKRKKNDMTCCYDFFKKMLQDSRRQ